MPFSFRLVILLAVGCSCACEQTSKPTRNEVPAPNAGARSVPELVRDLTRNVPDGSGPRSPALDELIEIGEPAIEPLLEVMLNDHESRRHYAAKGLYVIFARQCGLPKRGGWRDVELEENCRAAWGCLGNLSANTSLEDRQRAVELWRQWLASKPVER